MSDGEGYVFGTISDLAANERLSSCGERPYEVTIEEVPYFAWGTSKQNARKLVIDYLREKASMRQLSMADLFQAIRDNDKE